MQTDWLVIRRLAAELERSVRGSRIRGAGSLPDGRFGLSLGERCIVIDAFAGTPLVTLEAPQTLERGTGWVRATASALDGLRIEEIRSRRGDRLIAFDCATRSRFGVSDGYRLTVELVPRFGNVLLLKGTTIVAAAKEFTRAENSRRAVRTGDEYEPPPLPAPPTDSPELSAALIAARSAATSTAVRDAVDALRGCEPLVPRLAAESIVSEALDLIGAGAAAPVAARRCIERARALLSTTEGSSDALGPIDCYWRDRELVAASVIPLAQYAHLTYTSEASLLEVLARAHVVATAVRNAAAFDARRSALGMRLQARRDALAAESDALERERANEDARALLRRSGEALYAHLAEVPAGATLFTPSSDPELSIPLDPELDAKGNAAAFFRRYRKATAKLPHIAERTARLASESLHALELAWELERAEPETLGDVAEAVDRLERRPRRSTTGESERRKPLSVRLGDDARIYVGRSPRGNADLTFRIARPDDLWFHAQKTPGAHVVLHLDTARAPTALELERAAALAAFHSKARASEKVAVDFTERKFVRRRRDAPPGLVWYTNARTAVVSPAGIGE